MELRNCPFCGDKAVIRWESLENKTFYPPTILARFSICCEKCNAEMKPKREHVAIDDEFYRIAYTILDDGDIYVSVDERTLAASDWNRRHDVQ